MFELEEIEQADIGTTEKEILKKLSSMYMKKFSNFNNKLFLENIASFKFEINPDAELIGHIYQKKIKLFWENMMRNV